MCVVHDIAEAQVGDIAPSHGIPKEEKIRLETVRLYKSSIGSHEGSLDSQEAMRNIVHDMLHDSPAARRIEALWQVSVLLERQQRFRLLHILGI
jgi:putative hydrolases of HD superfamily